MICEKQKAIFIDIPKTAGGSIRKVLKGKGKHNCIKNETCTNYKGVAEKRIIDPNSIDLKEYWVFTVVRNPWDRLVSLYFHGRSKNKKYSNIPFGKFVKESIRLMNTAGNLNVNVKPMLDWIRDKDGNILVDFVARFENIEEDWDKIQSQLKMKKTKLPVVHKVKHKKYSEYYNDDLREMVAEAYQIDINHFNYEF